MASDKPHHDSIGAISRSLWFEGLPEKAHLRLAEAASVHDYQKGAYLYTIGEARKDVYCILSGRVRLQLTSTIGQEFALRDLEPETWLGEQFIANLRIAEVGADYAAGELYDKIREPAIGDRVTSIGR